MSRGPIEAGGDGERLMKRIEARAKAAGITKLFVLTTRTAHFFIKRGYKPATVDDLPPQRQNMYNWQRRSKILVKAIWNGAVVAESDATLLVEGNHYFPPDAVNRFVGCHAGPA